VDTDGNVDPTYSGSVTLALANNPGGATLGGTLTATAVNGLASFTGLTISKPGSGYTLKATAAGLSAGTSSPFDVTTDQLTATQPPASVAAGNPFGLSVLAENAFGVVDPGFNGSVTVALESLGGGNAALGGTLTATAVAGVATFSGLTVNQPGSYALLVTSNSTGTTATSAFAVTGTGSVVLPPGVTAVGSALYIVGGKTTNDEVEVSAIGDSEGGRTGVRVEGSLNGKAVSRTFTQAFTAIYIIGGDGNDHIELDRELTIATTITAGNGNDTIRLGDGNSKVTLGNGKDTVRGGDGNDTVVAGNGDDHVHLGDGNNVVTLGNGNDGVRLGDGNNSVTLGNGNDRVRVGDGSNVVITGNGHGRIRAGDGYNLIAAGLGPHSVHVGDGQNILIDGTVQLTQSGDTLRQVLSDWLNGAAPASIRARLLVTYNSSYPNKLLAGWGFDWFWETYAKDLTNRKPTDLLN
jgi:Ca2+-binding RTX toxin-like protein